MGASGGRPMKAAAQNEKISFSRQSTAESAAAYLRNGILTGRIGPGERLKEKELCEELDISRTPLREAFRILQTQNLIEYKPYIGVSAVSLSERYIREIWDVKMLLEPSMAALAAQKRTEEQLAEMRTILEEQEKLRADDATEFTLIDNRFHHLIGEMCGNRELAELVDNVYGQTALARSRSVYLHRSIRHSLDEHREICRAILEQNADAAKELSAKHLTTSLSAIVEAVLKDRGT